MDCNFAGFEAHGLARRNVDLFAGARIASDAGLARLDVEDAEAPQLDALAAAKRILQGLEDRLHGLLCLWCASRDVCVTTALTMSSLITRSSVAKGSLC